MVVPMRRLDRALACAQGPPVLEASVCTYWFGVDLHCFEIREMLHFRPFVLLTLTEDLSFLVAYDQQTKRKQPHNCTILCCTSILSSDKKVK